MMTGLIKIYKIMTVEIVREIGSTLCWLAFWGLIAYRFYLDSKEN